MDPRHVALLAPQLPSVDFGRVDTGEDVAALVLVEVDEDLTTEVEDCLVKDELVVFLDEVEEDLNGDEDLNVLVIDLDVVEGLEETLVEVVDWSVDVLSVDDVVSVDEVLSVDDDLLVALVEAFTVDDGEDVLLTVVDTETLAWLAQTP